MGFGFRACGFGLRVPNFGFRVSGFGFRTCARRTEDTIGRKLGRFGSASTSAGIPDFAQKSLGEKRVYQYCGGGAGGYARAGRWV